MSRVALTETFWRQSSVSDLVSFARNYQVYVYERGTEEKVPIYSAESGGVEVAQPLETDEGGRARATGGILGWLKPGSYDIAVNSQIIPFEVAYGSGSGLSEAALGVISHGGTAGTARGTDFLQYMWIGTVEPTHIAVGDLFVNTSTFTISVMT